MDLVNSLFSLRERLPWKLLWADTTYAGIICPGRVITPERIRVIYAILGELPQFSRLCYLSAMVLDQWNDVDIVSVQDLRHRDRNSTCSPSLRASSLLIFHL